VVLVIQFRKHRVINTGNTWSCVCSHFQALYATSILLERLWAILVPRRYRKSKLSTLTTHPASSTSSSSSSTSPFLFIYFFLCLRVRC
jgi:hypothetical protein